MHTMCLKSVLGLSYGASVHTTEPHLVEVDNPLDTKPQGTAENGKLTGGQTMSDKTTGWKTGERCKLYIQSIVSSYMYVRLARYCRKGAIQTEAELCAWAQRSPIPSFPTKQPC